MVDTTRAMEPQDLGGESDAMSLNEPADTDSVGDDDHDDDSCHDMSLGSLDSLGDLEAEQHSSHVNQQRVQAPEDAAVGG
jgi:hypothetical protein